MRKTKVLAFAILAASVLGAIRETNAQTVPPPPPLTTFVTNPANGATDLQRDTGIAVQKMCTELGREGGFGLDPTKPTLDTYLRCNELVQTASGLNGGLPTRSLNLTSGQLLGALQQVSGEELTSQGALTTRVSSGQFANISGRLNALRFGSGSAAARGRIASASPNTDRGYADRFIDPRSYSGDGSDGRLLPVSNLYGPDSDSSSASYAPVSYRAAETSSASGGGASSGAAGSKWGWFTEGNYNFGNQDQSAGEDGFDFDAGSATIGADYNFGSAVLGASAGYDRYKANFDTNALVSGGDVEVKGGSGSLFGAWFGQRLSVDGIVSYGSLSSDVSRKVIITSNNAACGTQPCPSQNRTMTGSPDGHYFSGGVNAAYDLVAASWNVTASVSTTYRDVAIDSYNETDSQPLGGLALGYRDQKIKSFRSILGLAASRSFSRSFGVITPNFRAEWHHEFKDDARTIRAQYVVESSLTPLTSECISCFVLQSNRPDKDFAVAGAGLSVTFARRLQAYVYYEALLGVSDLTSNSIAVGLRGQF